jgi:SAM-dependent methyltransferase
MNIAEKVSIAPKQVAAENVEQILYHVSRKEKFALLNGLLKREKEKVERMLLFVNTKAEGERLGDHLEANGFASGVLSGDVPQKKRMRILEQFKLGEIEDMPIENDTADVVVSNCVLNLVPDKEKAFAEMYRIIKLGGHFCVSDIVLKGELPEGLQKSAAMYAGCVSGAIQQEEYLGILEEKGFKNVEVKKTKVIELPDDTLKNYLSEEEINIFRQNKIGIFSITVVGYK